MAIFIKYRGHAFYFDSYGLEPNEYVKEFLKKFKSVTRNVSPLQSSTTNVCGHYCIYFLCNMSILSNDFNRIIRQLEWANSPDSFVRMFVNNLLCGE